MTNKFCVVINDESILYWKNRYEMSLESSIRISVASLNFKFCKIKGVNLRRGYVVSVKDFPFSEISSMK